MKFIYFTDIHLDSGIDAFRGFELCVESMLEHQPEVLINGGDLGLTPEVLAQYAQTMERVSVPVLLSHGNHEMCSGYLPREQGGRRTPAPILAASILCCWTWCAISSRPRIIRPTGTSWPTRGLLEWLAADLAEVDRATSLVVASHVPISTTFPQRSGQVPDMAFPTNEIAGAQRLLTLLQPFERVITLHGHHHENDRHFVGTMEVMTTAAVSGNWWKTALESRGPQGREPQGYRVVEVDAEGGFRSEYHAFQPHQDEAVELCRHQASGRRFVNVFDGSPRTQVEVGDLGPLALIDPLAESSRDLATHLWELPADFDRQQVEVRVVFEDGRECEGVLEERVWESATQA